MIKPQITPQDYIDTDKRNEAGLYDAEMVIHSKMKPHEAAAAVCFMTGLNGHCMDAFATPKSGFHTFFAARDEAEKGRTPKRKSTSCDGTTVTIEGRHYKLTEVR